MEALPPLDPAEGGGAFSELVIDRKGPSPLVLGPVREQADL